MNSYFKHLGVIVHNAYFYSKYPTITACTYKNFHGVDTPSAEKIFGSGGGNIISRYIYFYKMTNGLASLLNFLPIILSFSFTKDMAETKNLCQRYEGYSPVS